MSPEPFVTIGPGCLALISSQGSRSPILLQLAGGTRRFSARPPEMLPKQGEAVWHATTFGSVYVTADPARAGSALITMAVSNLGEHTAALVARGLSLDEQEADSSALRQLTITDGDGNSIKFFEDPAQPSSFARLGQCSGMT